MATLATVEDWYEFKGLGEVPDDLDRAPLEAGLARATFRVKRRLRFARYAKGGDGLPVEASKREAITAAVCATYDWMRDNGDGGSTLSGAQGWDSVSLIGVSFSKHGRSGGASVQSVDAGMFSPEADVILTGAGFFPQGVAKG